MLTLVKKTLIEGPFSYLMKEARLGDSVTLYTGDWDDWSAHPDGVLVHRGSQFLLNAEDLLFSGDADDYEPHPSGLVIRRGDTLLLNGVTVLHEGVDEEWELNPMGELIFEKRGQLLTASERVLLEGGFDRWEAHPEGVAVEINGTIRVNSRVVVPQFHDGEDFVVFGVDIISSDGNLILLNGKKVLYEGEWNDWDYCAHGVLVENDGELFLGKEKLCDVDEEAGWEAHPEGPIVESGDDLVLFRAGLVPDCARTLTAGRQLPAVFSFPHAQGTIHSCRRTYWRGLTTSREKQSRMARVRF